MPTIWSWVAVRVFCRHGLVLAILFTVPVGLGKILVQAWRLDNLRHASQAQPCQGATEPIGQGAEQFKVDIFSSNRARFHLLALDRDQRATPDQLLLTLTEAISAAKISGDCLGNVSKPALSLGAFVAIEE
jgi:hypothetical protein